MWCAIVVCCGSGNSMWCAIVVCCGSGNSICGMLYVVVCCVGRVIQYVVCYSCMLWVG